MKFLKSILSMFMGGASFAFSPESKVEFDKILNQLNGDYELWVKDNHDILTVTCTLLNKNAENTNHYDAFSVPNPQ